jgi:hydrogenase maturation protein HypF
VITSLARLKLVVRGAVQGVGFRPFIFRLANSLQLSGWVKNSAQGVFIEVEGPGQQLERFLLQIETDKPPRSSIQGVESSWLDPRGYSGFTIRESDAGGPKTALVLPDIATCPDCLREIFDPHNRRFGYPFTNCTNCGPRFTIIESLPYDRPNTSMKRFSMCPLCQAEYDDPNDRRFHAQPNACPRCGPQLELWNHDGEPVPGDPLAEAVSALRAGQTVAVKGLGGFHLLVAAHDEEAVRRLRVRKHREEKPLAVMFPSVAALRSVCEVSTAEERLLRAPEAPIVLLRRLPATGSSSPVLAPSLAPNNPNLGVLLPYTPLHHLLLASLGFPVVATSGNLSDEPICIDETEAAKRLHGIADLFLVHDRPILRHVDDSIVQLIAGRELVLRRARGFAPLPITFPATVHPKNVLAVGAHLKNTIALSVGPQVFISQHIGDLETDQASEAFRHVIADFEKLYEGTPACIATDAHPDYLSTKFAATLPNEAARITVQHHIAHVLSCMGENELAPPVLGVSWDGTGYGLDGTVWGGEFFLVTDTACARVAHLRPFRLPGGEKAAKQPRRTALGLLFEMFGERAFDMHELAPLQQFARGDLASLRTMLNRSLNSPYTSSVGRLFDGVASLLGLRQQVRFEGQAAMELEFAIGDLHTEDAYLLSLSKEATANASPSPIILDWAPLLSELLSDLRRKAPLSTMTARFHNGLAESIVALAKKIGQQRVVLSGGCFQNKYLTERTINRLRADGLQPYWHQRVPPNDGGISLGQVVAAWRA